MHISNLCNESANRFAHDAAQLFLSPTGASHTSDTETCLLKKLNDSSFAVKPNAQSYLPLIAKKFSPLPKHFRANSLLAISISSIIILIISFVNRIRKLKCLLLSLSLALLHSTILEILPLFD